MKWTDEVRVETPEQVEVDLEVAGLGSRFVAQVTDWMWKVLLSAALLLLAGVVAALAGASDHLENPSRVLGAGVVAVLYALWLGYGVFFEVRYNGQTPGKRAAGIRAIREGGGPLDLQAAAVRNLLALADFLPSFFLLGAVLILVTRRRQRLGDMAAGTLVVRERVVGLGPDPTADLIADATAAYAFTPAQLAALAPTDRAVVREFLSRCDDMDRAGRRRLMFKLADGYVRKTGYVLAAALREEHEARAFLASLLRDLEQARRHE